jgi:hypothetical protein
MGPFPPPLHLYERNIAMPVQPIHIYQPGRPRNVAQDARFSPQIAITIANKQNRELNPT